MHSLPAVRFSNGGAESTRPCSSVVQVSSLHRRCSVSEPRFSSFNFTFAMARPAFGGRAVFGAVPSSHAGKTAVFSHLHQRGEHKAGSPAETEAAETSAVSSSLLLFLPSTVSSVATSASSAALSHRVVGVSFVLPPSSLF